MSIKCVCEWAREREQEITCYPKKYFVGTRVILTSFSFFLSSNSGYLNISWDNLFSVFSNKYLWKKEKIGPHRVNQGNTYMFC